MSIYPIKSIKKVEEGIANLRESIDEIEAHFDPTRRPSPLSLISQKADPGILRKLQRRTESILGVEQNHLDFEIRFPMLTSYILEIHKTENRVDTGDLWMAGEHDDNLIAISPLQVEYRAESESDLIAQIREHQATKRDQLAQLENLVLIDPDGRRMEFVSDITSNRSGVSFIVGNDHNRFVIEIAMREVARESV